MHGDLFSNAVHPQKTYKMPLRAADETGYSEANSRRFRQFLGLHGAENRFHIAGGGFRRGS